MKPMNLSLLLIAAALAGPWAWPARGAIDGLAGANFVLTARTGIISVPEGTEPFMWGYAQGTLRMQYPGPTLIVKQGAAVTVTLVNTLNTTTSIVFPGQGTISSWIVSGQAHQGVLALEAGPGASVAYWFVAQEPGTYLYHSGTRPDLQVEMGLVGALIVQPAVNGTVVAHQAYHTVDSMYDDEFLFLLTEMDPDIHALVRDGKLGQVDTSGYFPKIWFINGRCAPDTMADAFASWLPSQPYNCMPIMEPGQKILLRLASPGRNQHPFHTHGNHVRLIARDGRLLASSPAAGADLAQELFTVPTIPGGTADGIFTWIGQGLGWDIYGHKPGDPKQPGELDSDHGKPFPVKLPDQNDQIFGEFYSGSPFLGTMGSLPPGVGGMNPTAGYMFMWHSHAEKEMVNNDIFPGGMMTMLLVNAPGTTPAMNAAPAASQGR